jgi:hypothetical protein
MANSHHAMMPIGRLTIDMTRLLLRPKSIKGEDAHHLAICYFSFRTLRIYKMTTETETRSTSVQELSESQHQPQYPRKALQLKGVLDAFESFDVTPVIGREFKDVNLAEWLRAPNSSSISIADLEL